MTNTERLENARELFEERAGIVEFSSGYPRNEAERVAKAAVALWLIDHPAEVAK